MFGLGWLKEPIQRCAKCRRTVGPVIRNADPRTPLRRGNEQVRAIEANSEIHRQAIRRAELVLEIESPLIPIRIAVEPKGLGPGEFAGTLTDVSGLSRLCVGDREGEILLQRQSRRFNTKFQRMTIPFVRETTEDAYSALLPLGAGRQWRITRAISQNAVDMPPIQGQLRNNGIRPESLP